MKAEVKDGIILIDHEDIISTYGTLADADIDSGNIIVTVDGQTSIIPLDGNWGDWSEVVMAWNEMFPNGKLKPEPVIISKQADEIDMLMMENLDMQLKLNEQEKLINQLIINSLGVGV